MTTMTNQEYFYFFLRHQIDSGVKQIDIVRSDLVDVSASYLNKLYLNPPKSCDLELQASIAKHFGLSYDEMIAEAKRLYRQKEREAEELHNAAVPITPPHDAFFAERRSYTLPNLINQMSFMTNALRKNHTYMSDLEKERDELQSLINDFDAGICIADSSLKITYQNPAHRKKFGNKISATYSFFWEPKLSKEELIGKLTTGNYETIKAVYGDEILHVQISIRYKGNRVDRVVEYIPPQQQNYESYAATSRQMQIYSEVFKKLDHGFAFFNTSRELELASNKFGILGPYDFPNKRPSVDQLLLDIGSRMESGLEMIPKLKNAYENKEEITFDLKVEGIEYNFQTLNIVENDTYQGMLLIVRKISKVNISG